MTIRDVLNDAAGRSKQELINLANNGACKFAEYCENVQHLSKDEFQTLIIALWKVFVSADRATDGAEYELFLSLFGLSRNDMSYQQFFDLTDGGSNPDYVNAVRQMLSTLPEDVHDGCCYLGVAIMACDREITDSEVRLLESFFD